MPGILGATTTLWTAWWRRSGSLVFRIPIVARSDGTVVDGHLRLKAARRLGLEEVPVVLADDLTEEQVKAFWLLANRSANWAEFDEELLQLELKDLRASDYDLEMTGFDEAELDRVINLEFGADGQLIGQGGDQGGGHVFEGGEDSIPPPPPNPVSKPGDLWGLGGHRLLCGSSIIAEDVIRLMKGERAILFATDPPYLVDYDGTNPLPAWWSP